MLLQSSAKQEQRYTETRCKKIKKESFDLKKEEDAEDGGKSDEEENGEGESDPFEGSLRDCKREHSSLVWVDKTAYIEQFIGQSRDSAQLQEECWGLQKYLHLVNYTERFRELHIK